MSFSRSLEFWKRSGPIIGVPSVLALDFDRQVVDHAHGAHPMSSGVECSFWLRLHGDMLLTITTTHRPATDIGYLLGKNPNRIQSFPVACGQVHVFYPIAEEEKCTAALLLDIDPIGLVRGRRSSSGDAGLLGQYVNDRPYVASSFLSVAIASVYGSAMKGYSKDRAELAETAIPLTAEIPVVPCRGGESFLRGLFEPLGYRVTCSRLPLDNRFPEWGESSYFSVALSSECRLKDLLTHLYVLLPVLDNDKHYWV